MAQVQGMQEDQSSLYSIEEIAAWVKPAHIESEALFKQYSSPQHYLLLEYQDRVGVDRMEYFMRTIVQINDAAHIEKNAIHLFEISPESQRIVLHACTVYRKGKALNRLIPENIRTLHREADLERQVSSDTITVELLIDDLRVGDTLDVSSTRVSLAGEHAVYGKYYHSVNRLTWGVPIDIMEYRLVNDSDALVQTQRLDSSCEKQLSKDLAPGETTRLTLSDLAISNLPNYVPSWYWPDCLVATTKQSWEEISAYWYTQNEKHSVYAVELDDADIDEIEGIDWHDNGIENVTKLVRFVQNNIRYRAESHGIHSHTPKKMTETLRRRTGDCKDKSTLLFGLLKKIGVHSELLLVNGSLNSKLSELPASSGWFNHMIVRIQLNGEHYVVDPTMQHQGGTIEHQARLNFAWGLPITPEGSALKKIASVVNPIVYTRNDEIDFRHESLASCTLTIERSFYHERADNMRSYLNSTAQTELEDSFLSSAKDDFQLDMKVLEAVHVIEDDQQKNAFRTREAYQLQGDFYEMDDKCFHYSTSFHENHVVPDSEEYPVYLSETGTCSHTVTAHYGKQPEKINEAYEDVNPVFAYKDSIKRVGNSIVSHTEFSALKEHIAAEEVSKCRLAVKALSKRSGTQLPIRLQLEKPTGMKDHVWYVVPIVGLVLLLMARKFL